MIVIRTIGFQLEERTVQEIKKKFDFFEKMLYSYASISVKITKNLGRYHTQVRVDYDSGRLFTAACNLDLFPSVKSAVSKCKKQYWETKNNYNISDGFYSDIEDFLPPGIRLCSKPCCICVEKDD